MRAKWLLGVACGLPVLFFFIFLLSAAASRSSNEDESSEDTQYVLTLEKEPEDWLRRTLKDGKPEFSYEIPFKIHEKEKDGPVVTDVPKAKIVVREAGKQIHEIDLFQPKQDDLTIVLAMDVSGSMRSGTAENGRKKIEEARTAAQGFLEQLSNKADVGLILFNHQVLENKTIEPSGTKDPRMQLQHRRRVSHTVLSIEPDGGTAYLDATHRAIQMLKKVKKGRKAVVVMTDGRDVDSREEHTVPYVANLAREEGIPVYTVGIGAPASNEPVSTILVLDHSGSMTFPASANDRQSKMAALKVAAARFVDLMPSQARSSLLPFSDQMPLKTTSGLTGDKALLKQQINGLTANGGTRLFQATEQGITELAKADALKRYLVVLTDGQDSLRPTFGSLEAFREKRIERIVDRAKDARIPLYTLGFGATNIRAKDEGVDESVLQKMAVGTGGKYFHARNRQELFKVFEQVSALLHGDGIDEVSLRNLASATNGAYYPARNAAKLQKQFKLIADELQSTYVAKFPSNFQRADGLKDKIEIYVVDESGKRVSNVGAGDVTRRGLVVPEISHVTYLVILGFLLVCLSLPGTLRRLYHSYGGA